MNVLAKHYISAVHLGHLNTEVKTRLKDKSMLGINTYICKYD